MARPRAADFDVHREQILAAAAALFARHGYAGATMQALADACGLSKATLYHYVRDKQALLARICIAHVARLELLVEDVERGALPPEAHLRCLIERFTASYADAQNEHRVLTEDMKFLDDEQRAAVARGQRRVVDAFARAVAAAHPVWAGGGAPALPKTLTMLLFGMINWTHTWLKPGGVLTHAQLAPMVSELFVGGLRALLASGAVTAWAAPVRTQSAAAAARRGRERATA